MFGSCVDFVRGVFEFGVRWWLIQYMLVVSVGLFVFLLF